MTSETTDVKFCQWTINFERRKEIQVQFKNVNQELNKSIILEVQPQLLTIECKLNHYKNICKLPRNLHKKYKSISACVFNDTDYTNLSVI